MLSLSLSEFADKINEIMPAVVREMSRRQTNELFRGKITLVQFVILEFLFKKTESKMKDLAQFMGVTTANMTGVVDRLIREGYVLRTYEPKDRRVIKIKLTNRGARLVKKINQQRRQMIIEIFGKLSKEERQDYLRILTHIRDILIKEKETR